MSALRTSEGLKIKVTVVALRPKGKMPAHFVVAAVSGDVLPSILAALADELNGFQLPQSPLGDGE
jgi:hypothetical protein